MKAPPPVSSREELGLGLGCGETGQGQSGDRGTLLSHPPPSLLSTGWTCVEAQGVCGVPLLGCTGRNVCAVLRPGCPRGVSSEGRDHGTQTPAVLLEVSGAWSLGLRLLRAPSPGVGHWTLTGSPGSPFSPGRPGFPRSPWNTKQVEVGGSFPSVSAKLVGGTPAGLPAFEPPSPSPGALLGVFESVPRALPHTPPAVGLPRQPERGPASLFAAVLRPTPAAERGSWVGHVVAETLPLGDAPVVRGHRASCH